MIPRAALWAIAVVLAPIEARACACCTDTAARHVSVDRLDASRLAEVEQVVFAKQARLRFGEADGDTLIKGVADPSMDYALEVRRSGKRMIFAFRDDKGRTGSLVLALPATISIFEVDPRDGEDRGLGPTLYKEWTLTAPALGDGLFKAATGPGRRMTLVLHGRGNRCTSYEQFGHWSLLVQGGSEGFTLYGALDSAGR